MSRKAPPEEKDAPNLDPEGIAPQERSWSNERWLERAESLTYKAVAGLFLLAAIGMLLYTLITVPRSMLEEGFPSGIITLINDLLLVVILLEILRTVLDYVEHHILSLRPFLIIAGISATRRILVLGAETAIGHTAMTREEFDRALLDLGANTGLILIVALALLSLSRARDHERK